MLSRETMKKGGRYNWKNQPERLIYLGWKCYPGDRRYWHQFAKVGDDTYAVWCEVLDSDLPQFEETPTDAAGVAVAPTGWRPMSEPPPKGEQAAIQAHAAECLRRIRETLARGVPPSDGGQQG